MRYFAVTLVTSCLLATAGFAQQQPDRSAGAVTYTVPQSFDDVVFGVENAIIGRGLVVDSVSHVGTMLERTRADVGSDTVLFAAADVLSFCSASLSRDVMEADIANIQFCPYDIFIYTLPASPDETTVGFRQMPDGAMQTIETLLDGIVREGIGLD